jgi:CheY-like chemotaxis protein
MDKMLRRLIGEDIDLATRLEPKLDRVKFDPGQIEQIIVNLVVNARDAMPQGGKITIQTSNVELDADYVAEHVEAREGSHVMIAVSDTGFGMDADTRKRIFEPFFTTKALGRGTGLGLSTVYGIVKQSGGNIWVYSEPGRGTTFKVYIPATEQKAADRSARMAAVRPKATETVLVVEDEEAVRKLVKSVLTGAGYEVLEAATPELAVQRASMHDGDIHLLLTDVVMPGMGGPQLAQKIVSARPTIKVLYMSGYTDNAIVHHGVLDPGTAFLEKPIRPEALQTKVREVLGG